MFATNSDSRAPASGDIPRAAAKGDDAPRAREDGPPHPRDVTARDPPPTWEQFTEMQWKYTLLQQQMDELLARNSSYQRAQKIDEELEARRKVAYESAGLTYSPRTHFTSSPDTPSSLPRSQILEYRISHKSIGYLRPAEASNKPFKAVDGKEYVRPLAWLANLRMIFITKAKCYRWLQSA